MRRNTLPTILLLSALAMTAFSGCAELSSLFRRTPPPAPAVKPPEKPPPAPAAPAAKPPEIPPPAPAVKPPAISVADKMFADGRRAFQEGRYERALEFFSDALQEQPGHAGVAREFDAAVLALKKDGDAAYAQGKWEDAGKRWMGTLRFINHPAANSRDYPFTRGEVRTKVDNLTKALTEKALTKYRRGEVSAAIADWKTILAYDPANEEAVKSLNTATTQLKQLKKLPPAPAPAPSPAPAAN